MSSTLMGISVLFFAVFLGAIFGWVIAKIISNYKYKKIQQNSLADIKRQEREGYKYSRKEGKEEVKIDFMEEINEQLKKKSQEPPEGISEATMDGKENGY